MEGVREGVRWGDVCVRLLLARPVGRLTDTTTLPPNASLPLPSTPIPSIHTQGTGHWASIAILCSTLDIAFVRMFSERVSRWTYLVRYAMLEYYGIRLVDRRGLLSLKDRVLVIESADYSSSDDWP